MGKKAAGSKKSKTGKPEIIAAKGGLTAKQLVAEILEAMPEEDWITKKQGRAFAEALEEVVLSEIGDGRPVNLFGLVKIVPRLHTAGQREVHEVFGDSTSPMVVKKAKAKTTFKVGQGIFTKRLKDALPNPNKLSKALGRG